MTVQRGQEMSMTVDHVGVHTTHCCTTHGCCYGDDNCPVANGNMPMQARLQCEICDHITQELRDTIAEVPAGIVLHRKDNVCEEWIVHTQLGTVPLVFYFNGQVVINTAPYSPDTLEWIFAKAKLMEVTNG